MNSSTTPKFDPNKPVTTKGGKAARIICQDYAGVGGYSIIALIKEPNNVETLRTYTSDGSYTQDDNIYCHLDLINPVKKGYVLVWEDKGGGPKASYFKSKADFERNRDTCKGMGWPILFSSEFDIEG